MREEISQGLLHEFLPQLNATVTLDSAFQHSIDMNQNQKKLETYQELRDFIGDGENVIGMTITDLQWNSLYQNDGKTEQNIRVVFTEFVAYLTKQGYKVLFVPQLFGDSNDYNYMNSFAIENCYTMSDECDCYFQQYVISRIKAVVGMRYHSNIFSAKMGTPFVSISYEQKMQGFMKKADLQQYCLTANELNIETLQEKFDAMMENYSEYKADLMQKKVGFQKEASQTTELVCALIEKRMHQL